MVKPLVSVLIPAFNSQHWIKETVESALAQSWQKKEVIVVDDGSTDGTLSIARQFASAGVKVVSQENQGAASARNTAYRLSQGDYIQWLDADDILHPLKVELQIKAITEQDLTPRQLVSGAWAYFIYRAHKAVFVPSLLWANLQPVEWLYLKMARNLHMQTDNWLVSRYLTEKAGPWDTRLWRDNDGEYFCRVISAASDIRFVLSAKSYYRSAGFKSISHINGSSKKLESLFISLNLHIDCLLSLEDSERTRSASVIYVQNWLHEFYPFRLDLADRLKQRVRSLGGLPSDPNLSWKYQWIVKAFGWSAARRAQVTLPRVRATARIAWDRAMHAVESGTAGRPSERQRP